MILFLSAGLVSRIKAKEKFYLLIIFWSLQQTQKVQKKKLRNLHDQGPKALDLFKSWCNLIVDHIFIDYLTILCNYNYTE